MNRCVRCQMLREDGSFYTDAAKPRDVCKACIHNPHRVGVKRHRAAASRDTRTQAAVRYVIKHTQAENELPYVYLVRLGDRYKIGYSKNVSSRIRQMETGSFDVPHLIAVAPGGRQLEQQLHNDFRGHRIKGECFTNSSKVFVNRFAQLPGAMVFLQGYVTAEAPVFTVTNLPLSLAS